MADIHDKFLEAVWHKQDGMTASQLASEYVKTFTEQLRTETENALPVQNDAWKTKSEVTLDVAFSKTINLAECQKQMRDARIATHKKIEEDCRKGRANASPEQKRLLYVRELASLWCDVLRKNRPSSQDVVEEVKKTSKQ